MAPCTHLRSPPTPSEWRPALREVATCEGGPAALGTTFVVLLTGQLDRGGAAATATLAEEADRTVRIERLEPVADEVVDLAPGRVRSATTALVGRSWSSCRAR